MITIEVGNGGSRAGVFMYRPGSGFSFPDQKVSDIAAAEIDRWHAQGWTDEQILDGYRKGWSNGYLTIKVK